MASTLKQNISNAAAKHENSMRYNLSTKMRLHAEQMLQRWHLRSRA
jgi:hypothetical protein